MGIVGLLYSAPHLPHLHFRWPSHLPLACSLLLSTSDSRVLILLIVSFTSLLHLSMNRISHASCPRTFPLPWRAAPSTSLQTLLHGLGSVHESSLPLCRRSAPSMEPGGVGPGGPRLSMCHPTSGIAPPRRGSSRTRAPSPGSLRPMMF